MAIKVSIADDHDVVVKGVEAVLSKNSEIKIIDKSSNGKELLRKAKSNPADVYVLDIAMPVLNGLETAERLIKMNSESKVIIFSLYDERNLVKKALKAGVKGYVLKENISNELVMAIEEVNKNNYFLTPKISKYIVENFLGRTKSSNKKKKLIKLTKREKEILQLIAEGNSNKKIAEQLFLSIYTVRAHRNNIMQKLDLHSQADLIRYAIKEGITQLEFFSQSE